METKTIRKYYERQPRVGDRIEIIKNRTSPLSGFILDFDVSSGQEMVITNIKQTNAVKAIGERYLNEKLVYDNNYRIYEDITLMKTGEDIVAIKFLGIPFGKRIIEHWEEIGGQQ